MTPVVDYLSARLMGTIGRRDDVGKKKVRTIFAQMLNFLVGQMFIAIGIKKGERGIEKKGNGIFDNINRQGNIYGRGQVIVEGLVESTKAALKRGVDVYLNQAQDFPSWDNYSVAAVRGIFLAIVNDISGWKVKLEGQEGKWKKLYEGLRSVYSKYWNASAAYRLHEGDGDTFMICMGNITSGDMYTSTLNSLVHALLLSRMINYAKRAITNMGELATVNEKMLGIKIGEEKKEEETGSKKIEGVVDMSMDATKTRVFGDDGYAAIRYTYDSPAGSSSEYEKRAARIAKTMHELDEKSAGLYGYLTRAEEDTYSIYTTDFLRLFHEAGAISRRMQIKTVYESDPNAKGKIGVVTRAQAAQGLLVSGQNTSTYYDYITMYLVMSIRTEVEFGKSREVPIGTYLLPNIGEGAVSGVPSVTNQYAFQVASRSTFPKAIKVLVREEERVRDIGKSLLRQSKGVFAKTGDEIVLGERITEKGQVKSVGGTLEALKQKLNKAYVRPGLKEHGYKLTNEDIRLARRRGARVDMIPDVDFEGSAMRGYETNLGEFARNDSVLGKHIRAEELPKARIEERNWEGLQYKFRLGLNEQGEEIRINLRKGMVGALISAGNGKIKMVIFGNEEKKTDNKVFIRSMFMPRLSGTYGQYQALQGIYGMSLQDPKKNKISVTTSSFSLESKDIDRIRGEVFSYSRTVVDRLEILKVMGFVKNAREVLTKLERSAESLEIEVAESWRSSTIPEMTLSVIWAETAFDKLQEDEDMTIVQKNAIVGTMASMMYTSTLYKLPEIMEKNSIQEAELYEYIWNTSNIVLGTVFDI
jgi:hypothetical protein